MAWVVLVLRARQVIFKSCKLIPVMVGGVLIQRKKYNLLEYTASLLLSFGLIVFTLADIRMTQATYNYTGKPCPWPVPLL